MKALHLVFGATIALGVGDAAADRGPPGGGGGSGRSSSRMGRRASSSVGGRDGRSSINDYGSSSSTNSRRSVDDILDLDGPDGLLMDDGYADSSSFNLLDDDFGVDGLMDDLGRFENGKDILDYSLSEDEFEGLSGDSDEGDDIADGLMGGSTGRDGEDETFGQGSEKGALYDAYNLLHSLAQVG